MGFLSPSSLHWGHSSKEDSQGGGQDTHFSDPPFHLGPRLLPVAAGRPGGTLGLGSPRAEGPAVPRVETVTARRVASCPHGCGQQIAEVAAPEGPGGHGGGARLWPSEAHPARPLAPLPGARMPAALRIGSCPQLPDGSPRPHASSLASWPDPSPHLLFLPQAPVCPSLGSFRSPLLHL